MKTKMLSLLAIMTFPVLLGGDDSAVAVSRLKQKKKLSTTQQDSATLKHAKKRWETIRTAVPWDPKKYRDGSIVYWQDVAGVIVGEFDKISEMPDLKEGWDYYVKQFGKHGPQADMRWLIAVRHSGMTPDILLAAPIEIIDVEEPVRKRLRMRYLFAELQVRQFLKKPDLLKRYYQALVWRRVFLRKISFPVIHKPVARHLQDKKDETYWYYARDFLLLAHATGRDDLLQNAKPKELWSRYLIWIKWLLKNGMYLRASEKGPYWAVDFGEKKREEEYIPFLNYMELPPLKVFPKYPFPDWKGPKPAKPERYTLLGLIPF